MTPKSCAHMRTMSPWGVAAKWPAQALKMKLIPGLRDPQGYSRISLSLSGRILKEYQNIVSAAELPGSAIRTGKYAIFLTTEDHVPVGLLYCDESTDVSRLIDFVFCFSLSCLIKLDWSTTELQWCWISHFFCVPQYKLLLYITSKVVSNVAKSSASDDLLHVNCNITNQTQTCFQSTQVVYCLPGVWVLVLYWRPFYFVVVIVESLLRIFIYRSFCFRCSAVCFGAFCTAENAVGFKFRFDMRYSRKFVKLYSAKCSLHKWMRWGAASKSARLKCTNLVHFCLTEGLFCRSLYFGLLVNCYSLLQHSRPAWLELFVDHTHTHSMNNLRWQPNWLPKLRSLPRKSHDWWRTRDCSFGQPT